MLRPSSRPTPSGIQVQLPPPITGAMRKQFHTFPRFLSLLAAVAGLIATVAFPSIASARHHRASTKGLTSAQAVKTGVTSSRLDPDRDGLTSWTEIHTTRTDPRRFDTDGDGFGDGAEVIAGTNPRDPRSTPLGPPAPPSTTPTSPQQPVSPPDTTAPETTISSGPSGTTTSTSASFGFGSSESGSSFQCSLDSGAWSSCASPKSYGSVAVGSHTFSVKATDGAGNADASPATRSWTVQAVQPPADTTAPQTTIDSGTSGATTATSASFGFSSSESGSSFQCSLDSGAWSSCTSPKSYGSVAVGSHTFSVKATDGAGNADASPATRSWTVQSESSGGGNCTQTLSSGANIASAISGAPAGAVICLGGGSGSVSLSGVHKSNVTLKGPGTLSHSLVKQSSGVRFSNLHFTGGLELIGATDDIQILDNEFSGEFGVRANGEDAHFGTDVTNVLIEGNYLHDLDFSGEEGTAGGYGMTLVNGVEHFTIRDNTIKSVGNDYIQSASPVDFTVEGNTFLGPSLRYSHANVHQDLWQIFGGGREIAFTDNVARDTGTHESLLFQTGTFNEVRVENNLFDNDSDGYTCQIYPVQGLIFRDNTIVDSHWGCLFRTEGGTGTDYAIDHNVFVDTEENSDLSAPPSGWGTYDYNVSSDGSAGGTHSVRNWSPSWADSVNFVPQGLPIEAGYRP